MLSVALMIESAEQLAAQHVQELVATLSQAAPLLAA